MRPIPLLVALITFLVLPAHADPTLKSPIPSGIVLTFDDREIDQWVKQIPLFAKYDAKVTFFVDHFHTLKPEQIEGLRQLKAAGHTVGCHGVGHRKAVDTIQKVGVEEYLIIEIDPAVQRMTDAGLAPTSFAYPSSQRNAETDLALKKSFRHLRGGTGVPEGTRIADLNTIFYTPKAIADTHCLIGTGIDYTGTEKRPDYLEQIKEAMDRAKAKGEVVVFYAHGISAKGPGHHIPPKALEAILAHAQTIGLATLTYDDLP